jgi:hypothetical protein
MRAGIKWLCTGSQVKFRSDLGAQGAGFDWTHLLGFVYSSFESFQNLYKKEESSWVQALTRP